MFVILRKSFYLSGILVLLSFSSCNSQYKSLNKKNLIEDLEFLNKAIKVGHPIILNKSAKPSLDASLEALKNLAKKILTHIITKIKLEKLCLSLGVPMQTT